MSDIDRTIKILDMLILIGKCILPISIALALLSAAAALNSVAAGSIPTAVFWSVLTLAGVVFIAQLVARRRPRARAKTAEPGPRMTSAEA